MQDGFDDSASAAQLTPRGALLELAGIVKRARTDGAQYLTPERRERLALLAGSAAALFAGLGAAGVIGSSEKQEEDSESSDAAAQLNDAMENDKEIGSLLQQSLDLSGAAQRNIAGNIRF